MGDAKSNEMTEEDFRSGKYEKVDFPETFGRQTGDESRDCLVARLTIEVQRTLLRRGLKYSNPSLEDVDEIQGHPVKGVVMRLDAYRLKEKTD